MRFTLALVLAVASSVAAWPIPSLESVEAWLVPRQSSSSSCTNGGLVGLLVGNALGGGCSSAGASNSSSSTSSSQCSMFPLNFNEDIKVQTH